MLIYILGAVALVLLVVLYRKSRSRKAFYGFTATIALAGALAFFLFPAPKAADPPASYARAEEQQIFSRWYAEYQREMIELDQNWQLYHQILASYQEGETSLESVYLRLAQLEENETALIVRIEGNKIPLELSSYPYDLSASIQQKTLDYARAQCLTITLTKQAADPQKERLEEKPQNGTAGDAEESIRARLESIMLKNSPAALFTAEETTALRSFLALPEEETSEETEE